jgi:hypothetical protein
VRFLKFPTEDLIRIILKDFAHATDERLMAQLPALIGFLTSMAETDKVERRTSGRDKGREPWPSLSPSTKLHVRWSAVREAKQQPHTSWEVAYQTQYSITLESIKL